MPTQVTGKPICMYDRCKGAVSTFVDGVPVCSSHRKHAIDNAHPNARIDEAGDWVLKKPKDITMPPPVAGDYTFDTDAIEEQDSAIDACVCFLCAFEENKIVAATFTHKGKHLCAAHHHAIKDGKRKSKKKIVASESFDFKPRRIRLPEGDE